VGYFTLIQRILSAALYTVIIGRYAEEAALIFDHNNFFLPPNRNIATSIELVILSIDTKDRTKTPLTVSRTVVGNPIHDRFVMATIRREV
jgi:hypothetical protein